MNRSENYDHLDIFIYYEPVGDNIFIDYPSDAFTSKLFSTCAESCKVFFVEFAPNGPEDTIYWYDKETESIDYSKQWRINK